MEGTGQGSEKPRFGPTLRTPVGCRWALCIDDRDAPQPSMHMWYQSITWARFWKGDVADILWPSEGILQRQT